VKVFLDTNVLVDALAAQAPFPIVTPRGFWEMLRGEDGG
jgi:hypothetical protein